MKAKSAFVLALSLTAANAWAADYHVSTSGDDNADGLSPAMAWRTLYKASTSIADGDTILLHGGDTWLVTASRRDPGSSPPGDGLVEGIGLTISNSDVTVDVYGDEARSTIDATAETDIATHNLINAYAPIAVLDDAHHVTIRNLALRGPALGAALYLRPAHQLTVERCELSGAGWTAESLMVTHYNASDVVVQDCHFDQFAGNGASADTTGYSKSIEIRGGAGHIVRRNTFFGFASGGGLRFSNNGTGGLVERNYFYGPDTRKEIAWALVVRSCDGGTYLVRNNVFDLTDNGTIDGGELRGIASWDDHATTIRKIFHNTFIGADAGYGIHSGGADNRAANNIFYGLQAGWNNVGDDTTLTNNIFFQCGQPHNDGTPAESGSLSSDPNLVHPSMSNREANDANLLEPSDAIDGGDPSDPDLPLDDFNGNVRSDGPDIGAFEYGGEPPTDCATAGGTCCQDGEACEGGSFTYSTDCGSRCCVGGTCGGAALTCSSAGYRCCTECADGAHPEYDGDCGSERCCEFCEGPEDDAGVSPTDPDDVDSDGGCGCRLGSRASTGGAAAGLLALLLVGLRRRSSSLTTWPRASPDQRRASA